MALSSDDLMSIKVIIEGAIATNMVTVKKLVDEHEMTIYGPRRDGGLYREVVDIKVRLDKADSRYWKLAGILAGVQAAFFVLLNTFKMFWGIK
jgi:hypothetical protein